MKKPNKDRTKKNIAHTNPTHVKRRSQYPHQSGSVMVGVMVALVFIGIVTAAMVKATGGQSTASRSYGSTLLMSSTANSGIIATESFFHNATAVTNVAGREQVTEMINAVFLDNNTQYINFGGNLTPGHKFELSKNPEQFFSSKIVDVITQDGRFFARVEVNSGRNPTGRDLQKATAFFEVENLMIDPGTPIAKNAFYMGTSALTGNAPVRIEGHATFADNTLRGNNATTQMNSTSKMEFVADSDGRGSVFFQGPVNLDSPNITFETKAYFNGTARFQATGDNSTVFQNSVGFNGDYSNSNSAKVTVNGDVWLRGGLNDPSGTFQNSSIIVAEGSSRTFHHTARLGLVTPNCVLTAGTTCPVCGIIGQNHIGPGSTNPDAGPSGFNMNSMASMDSVHILNQLNMEYSHLSQRKEPDLEFNFGQEKFFDIGRLSEGRAPEGRWGMPDGAYLTQFINNARNNPDYAQYFHPDPKTGHFLIDMNSNQAFPANGAGVLDEKVVFYVNENPWGQPSSPSVNGNFYTSGPNVENTMMVYVGPKGTLHDFGSHGDFRGLIYVHPDNDNNHTFRWNAEGKIDGALLLSGGDQIFWNSQSHFTTISKNDDALASFGSILKIPDAETPNDGEITIKTGEVVGLRLLGVYFQ
jgi:Tfp pilus assembly protein PilX